MYWDRFDICAAYYMFSSLYHSGQWSKEYAYIGRIHNLGYSPGLSVQSQDPDRLEDNAREIFDRLVEKAGFPPYSEETEGATV